MIGQEIRELSDRIYDILEDSGNSDLSNIRKISKIQRGKNLIVGKEAALSIFLKYLEKTTPYDEKKYRNNVSAYHNKISRRYDKVANKL